MASSFFSGLYVKDFPFERDVIVIDSTTPVDKAFKTLVEHRISAAPVFDSEKQTYLGFFDVSDMIAYIVEMITTHAADASAAPLPGIFNDLAHFLMVVTHYVPVTVEQVANHSHNSPFLPVYDDAPLIEILKLLSTKGVHRVPVIDRTTGRITKLITQSAITKWFSEHAQAMEIFGNQTVDEAKLGLCKVVTVASDALAVQALQLLASTHLSGVGLVDPSGVMITTLSKSDLRVLTTGKKFRLLGVTALQLVQSSRSLEANARPAVVCVRLSTHISDIVARLAATGLHRVYVLDDHEKPIGVISLRDIISSVLPKITQ